MNGLKKIIKMLGFKELIKVLILKMSVFERLAIFVITKKKLLPKVICNYNGTILKKDLLLEVSEYNSQLNQDVFALILNKFKTNGYFIEIGANDGFNLSNTIYLEEEFSWDGLLIEPNPIYKDSLSKRKAKSIEVAIGDNKERLEFSPSGLYGGLVKHLDNSHSEKLILDKVIEVETLPLLEVLQNQMAPKRIDFISIDVEGFEKQIVKQISAIGNEFRFSCGCIEHNNRYEDKIQIIKMLEEANYSIVWKDLSYHDLYFTDNLLKS